MKRICRSLVTIVFLLFGTYSFAQRLVVGTYTDNGKSKGIYIYDFNIKTGEANEHSYTATGNPSFLAIDKSNKFLYAVNEFDQGQVTAFAYDKKAGKLYSINVTTVNGSAPCYVSIDNSGKWLFVGNYGSGDLTVHSIHADGSVGVIHQFVKHQGSSTNKDRQSSPHVHCTYMSVDNKQLFVPDLGLDKVMIYPFDASTGLLDTANKKWISIKAGGGPRHIEFSKTGKFGYLIEEMSGNVNVIQKSGKDYKIVQTENHLPKGQQGAGADIHLSPDGKFLYTSQRSNSTIEIYSVNPVNGRIKFLAVQSTLGNFPRNFTIHPSGKFLLAANQRSGDISIFKRNTKTGLLTNTGYQIKLDRPVCLKWIAE